MSVEQIGNLVDAANRLTSEISGKMQGIDSRMQEAETQFDKFTGLEFPKRVSDARAIKIYLDTINGDDANTGLYPGQAVATWGAVRNISGGGATIYDVVDVRVAAGSVVTLDTAVHAKSELWVSVANGEAGQVTSLVQGFYGGSVTGRPMQPFRAPFVYINGNSETTELHTAEFKEGHSWDEAAGRSAAWMNYVGGMIHNTSRIKLRAIDVKLHDMPLSMVYMGGSMGDYANYQIVLGASCDLSVEAAGAGSVDYTNSPLLLYCYENPKIPLDIIADNMSISGNITSVSELFGNLDTLNVRSSFVI